MSSRKALAVLLLAAGCTAAPPVPPPVTSGPPERPALAAHVLPVVALRWENLPDRPDGTAAKPEGAPVSLTSSDGEGLAVRALEATAVVEDPLAFTELHFTFKNPSPRAIEGRFEITLPPGATISRFAMRQEWGWQEGEVVELQAARAAYEDALHRRTDPALLEKQAGNRFQARVFPIAASGEKEIIFSYSQELTRAGDPYRLYLNGLPRLGALDVRVLYDKRDEGSAGRRSFELHQTDFKPDHDFALPLAMSEATPEASPHGLRRDRLAVARITPVAEAAPDPVGSLLVLFDTSASRALGFRAEVERLGALVEALRKVGGADLPLSVLCFDQDVEVIHDGPAGAFGPRELDAILARKPLGASDLGKALHRASGFIQSHARRARVLVMSDGVVTAGETDAAEYKPLLAGLRAAGVERLDALVDGGIRDEALLKQLAVGGLARDGMTLDGALPTARVAERLNQRAVSGIKVEVPGSAWVWPAVLDGVQPGDQTVIYADLPEDKPFEVVLGGTVKPSRQTLITRTAEAPLLERALVNAEIRRLMDQLQGSTDDARREGIKQHVIALSTKYRVLSDFTGLLILETDADYARFKIDRQALAEILTVGPVGVELLDRTRAALKVAAEEMPVNGFPWERTKDVGPAGKASKGGDKQASATSPAADERPLPPAPVPQPAASTTMQARSPGAPSSAFDAPLPPPPPPPPVNRAAAGGPPPRGAPRPSAFRADMDGDAPSVGAPAPMVPQAMREEALRTVPNEHARSVAPAPARRPSANDPSSTDLESSLDRARGRRVVNVAGERGPAPYTGQLKEVMDLLASKKPKEALELALRWHDAEPGDVLALVGLGETYEALGQKTAAGRAYGSIIDLFPSRADLRRFAGGRLARLGTGTDGAFDLVLDTYRQAVVERPDHPASHRFYAYALARAGRHEDAFRALLAGARRSYPSGRFAGIERIFRDDLGILAAAWIRAQPSRRQEVLQLLKRLGVALATHPSLRFVLTWETDGNDVDFHIHDAAGGHAFYQSRALPSGGELYADVTTGYGPECFTIDGHPRAYPYLLQAHYYSRGPMGYGMGNLEVMEHDGQGGLKFDERPYVVMVDQAFVNLGTVAGPLR